MIIDLERKRSLFLWCTRSKAVPTLEERPNKQVNFLVTMWEDLFYGPEFTSEEDSTDPRDKKTINGNVDQRLLVIADTMKDMQQQMNAMQQKMVEIQEGIVLRGNHFNQTTDGDNLAEEKRNRWTQFKGYSRSFEGSISDLNNAGSQIKRNAFTQPLGSFKRSVSHYGNACGYGASKDVITEQQDVKDEKDREENEFDPVLLELKELHKKTPLPESDNIDKMFKQLSRRTRRRKSRRVVLVD